MGHSFISSFRVKQAVSGIFSEWYLQREQEIWVLGKDATSPADATVVLDQESAWRLFTKGISKEEAIQGSTLNGNETLARKVFDTISIIA